MPMSMGVTGARTQNMAGANLPEKLEIEEAA